MKNKQLLTLMLLVCFSLIGQKQAAAQDCKAFGPFSLYLEQTRNEQVLGLTDSTAALTITTPQSFTRQKKKRALQYCLSYFCSNTTALHPTVGTMDY